MSTDSLKTKKQNSKRAMKRKKPEKALSGLDAAAKILGDAKEPLDSKTIVERALAGGLWQTSGKTPSATVYAAMIREIAKKGEVARFVRVERGKFTLKS